jgi:predicted small metal-binding protein
MQGCTLNVSGSEKEVVETGVQHAVSAHSQKDTPQLRDQIRSMLKDEQ